MGRQRPPRRHHPPARPDPDVTCGQRRTAKLIGRMKLPQNEVGNDISAVLRRVEQGESLVVTVDRRPVALLSSAAGPSGAGPPPPNEVGRARCDRRIPCARGPPRRPRWPRRSKDFVDYLGELDTSVFLYIEASRGRPLADPLRRRRRARRRHRHSVAEPQGRGPHGVRRTPNSNGRLQHHEAGSCPRFEALPVRRGGGRRALRRGRSPAGGVRAVRCGVIRHLDRRDCAGTLARAC